MAIRRADEERIWFSRDTAARVTNYILGAYDARVRVLVRAGAAEDELDDADDAEKAERSQVHGRHNISARLGGICMLDAIGILRVCARRMGTRAIT